MKYYNLSGRQLSNRDAEAIQDTGYHRQSDIYILAKTKKAAIELLEDVGYGHVRTEHLTIAMGNQFDALVEADLFDTVSVLVTSMSTRSHNNIIRIRATEGDSEAEFIGTFGSNPDYTRYFIPLETKES